MADRMAAERACKEPNPIIDGRKANVNLAYLGAKPRQNGLASKLWRIYIAPVFSTSREWEFLLFRGSFFFFVKPGNFWAADIWKLITLASFFPIFQIILIVI